MTTTLASNVYASRAKSEDGAFVITYPDADIILVSSDNQRFRLHRSLLSLASPVFAGMPSIRQPANRHSEPDAIHLSEDGETIRVLFDILYPNRKLTGDVDFSVLQKVGAAAHKYQADGAIDYFTVSLWMALHRGEDPRRVYAIASMHDIMDLAAAAADASLSKPLPDYTPREMMDISGAAIIKLDMHRKRRQKLIDSLLPAKVLDAELVGTGRKSPWAGSAAGGCVVCPRGDYSGQNLPIWFIAFLMRLRDAFILLPRGCSVKSVKIEGYTIWHTPNKISTPIGGGYVTMDCILSRDADDCVRRDPKRCICRTEGPALLRGFLDRLAAVLDGMLEQVSTLSILY